MSKYDLRNGLEFLYIRIGVILFLCLAAISTAISEEEIEVYAEPGPVYEATEEENDEFLEQILSTSVYSSDSDDLAASYIDSVLPVKNPRLRFYYPSGWRRFTSGTPERNLYDYLRAQIADLAASGTDRTSSAFTIDAMNVFKAAYTAEELGVDALFTENGKVTTKAANALRQIFNTFIAKEHFSPIYICLLADSPYDFYWLDTQYKRNGTQVLFEIGTPEIEFGRYPNDDTHILLRGKWTISFPISRDYAEIPSQWDGSTMLTEMDPDMFQWVKRSTDNINAIIAETAGLDDYDKMKYYRNWIKEHCTYNATAEEELNHGKIGYGDPWQLIWVFDGKPETKVVCEGFAKAFNYLCDLGTSEAYSMEARGTLGGRPHMWNIVHIDGHSYLVDITNDNSNYDLFLSGAIEGSVSDGYVVQFGNGTLTYRYTMVTTPREEGDLQIPEYCYQTWRTETSLASVVQISSDVTYPDYKIAIKAQSSGGILPVEQIVVIHGEESMTYDGDLAEVAFSEDAEISIAAVVDGQHTAETEAYSITVAAEPGLFSLPAGAFVEEEAFVGIAAPMIRINGNEIEPGVFDADVILAVDEIGEWFESCYRFVIKPQGRGENE